MYQHKPFILITRILSGTLHQTTFTINARFRHNMSNIQLKNSPQTKYDDFLNIFSGNHPTKKRSLNFYFRRYLFNQIDFAGKYVLDIGAGSGTHSFYSAIMGAKLVVSLEPQAQGARQHVLEQFNLTRATLSLQNVILETIPFQDYYTQQTFDILLLHNSINHLDELSCMNLLHDNNAKTIYYAIFKKLYNIANKNAYLIISDCSRHNFFQLMGIKNPFAPTIEWHKHHTPRTWATMLESVGFRILNIKWDSFSRLGFPARVFLGNKIFAYFLRSHFLLLMQKH